MRVFLFYCLMIFGFVSSASAQGCNTNLGSNPKISDIQKILVCLNDRIKSLEAQVSGQVSASNGLDQRYSNFKAKRSVKNSVKKNGIIIALDRCDWATRKLTCHYTLTNTTKQDQKLCFMRNGSRLVLDSGQAFSVSYRKVAASRNTTRSEVCDIIPPLVVAKGSIWFTKTNRRNTPASKIQLIRLHCGGSCVHEAYDVVVE